MKKNYILGLFATVFLLVFQLGQAQNDLASNEFGSLIQNWLDQNKEKHNLTENDLSNLLVTDSYFSKKTRINHVYVNQAYQGLKIHNAKSSIAIKDNNVFYYANGFIQNIAAKVNTVSPVISAEDAISAVVNEYNLGSISNMSEISHSNNDYVFSNSNVSQSNIPVALVLQPTINGDLKLAWDLNINALSGEHWYSVRVDATNGEVLSTNDWVVKCSYGDGNHATHKAHKLNTETVNLFKTSSSAMMVDGSQYSVVPFPFENPLENGISVVSEPADVNASPYGWHDFTGSAGAEFTITRGNNVYAQDDRDGNNGFGYAPDGGATLNFDYSSSVIDLNPYGFEDLSLTNLFYVSNVMHDVWYQYGFDEVSGNFQLNNYGNGGSQNDSVIADGQDGIGFNNANFSTPPDGNNPRMQMFLWDTTTSPLNVNSGGPIIGEVVASYPAPTDDTNNVTFPSPEPVTADLVLVNSGGATPTEGCSALVNSSAVSGKIAVIKRGTCNFTDKIQNAQNAGAVGVIMVNHNNPTNDPAYTEYVTMAGFTTPVLAIPSVFINNLDGEQLIAALSSGTIINATLSRPTIDGSLDNEIVAHEYGHGISTRLAGGPSDSNCLGNAEQMGEGWSDWFGMMITMKTTDLATDARGYVTYSVGQELGGVGIRPFPYSTDTSVNPLTYADTNNELTISSPHGIGTVWATILWDLTWDYIDKYGFDTDVYYGTGGNNKIMQLVLDGLKLQGCDAGFINGRDGILAADMALTGGEDQCMIWEAFAARGVGVNASQGSFASRLDQVEDFTQPDSSDPTLQNCTSLSVDEFKTSNYSIFPNPANNMLNIKVKKNFGDVKMTLTDINGRIVLTKNVNLASEAQLNISALQSGMYILTIKGDGINTNDKILKN
ncbi:T9SS-dependent M36 family metallopeptidase [Lacinutrix mariniflava]|uniref:T9SS-dependent M36 family metallopeptidase n=1 Tax=Lacinutrix mariniflava TaxID=342955 RepID=UPI0006E4024D|nr:T9SS-dependent M36 family metallopeptidase [Lacinutrix mariniflava]